MYENYKICPDLKPSELCIVVEKYEPESKSEEGFVIRKFHLHVFAHRINKERRRSLQICLVAHFEKCHPEKIVWYHLNKRGKSPSKYHLNSPVSYPEPGVIRFYCGTDPISWIDEVISEERFRK